MAQLAQGATPKTSKKRKLSKDNKKQGGLDDLAGKNS
jgi:hypothetical protein